MALGAYLPQFVPLSDDDSSSRVPAWDELHTPLGVYLLLRELTEPARRRVGTDRLLVGWYCQGWHVGRGAVPSTLGTAITGWSRRAGLTAGPAGDGEPGPLEVFLPRLRLSAATVLGRGLLDQQP